MHVIIASLALLGLIALIAIILWSIPVIAFIVIIMGVGFAWGWIDDVGLDRRYPPTREKE